MSRPQVTVTITEELPRRGSPTDTGTAFFAFAAGTGATESPVVECRSMADAAAAFPGAAYADIVAWVGDALTTGAANVVLVRAVSADADISEAEWTAALDRLGEDYGPGQVAIPGVTTQAAYDALTAHANTHRYRCVLRDGAKDADAEDLIALVAAVEDEVGAPRIITLGGWVPVSAPAGLKRDVPPSVLVAGLVARADAALGHANNSPAVTQGRDAGVIRQGLGVSKTYTDAERDALNDGGVSVIRLRQGLPTLYGWRSASTESRTFRGAGAGRMTMQIDSGFAVLMEQFLERGIDGQGFLYAEVQGALTDYLEQQWQRGALYGATADEAFRVRVADVNTPADAANEVVRAVLSLRLTRAAERIELTVAVTTAEGSVAA